MDFIQNFSFSWFLLIIVLMVVVFWLTSCIVLTKNKTVSILETFGKYSGEREAGLSFKLPAPFQTVASRISLNQIDLDVNMSLKTSDNLFIQYPISVQLKVINPQKATYELSDAPSQLKSYISSCVRAEVGQKTFMQIYNQRNEIEEAVKLELAEKFSSFGYEIVGVLAQEPIPPQEVSSAYAKATSSEMLKIAASNEADAAKIRVVREAEAQKEAKRLQGEGIADQRKAIADGFKLSCKEIASDMGVSEEAVFALLIQNNKYDVLRDISNNAGSLIVTDVGPSAEANELVSTIKSFKSLEALHNKNV